MKKIKSHTKTIRFTGDSRVEKILCIIACCGEISPKTLRLLGSEKSSKYAVWEMKYPHDIALKDSKYSHITLLNQSGSAQFKTLRLAKGSLPIIDSIDNGYFAERFGNTSLSGADSAKMRHHRIGDVLAMCLSADIEYRPWVLPKLGPLKKQKFEVDHPMFYMSRDIKLCDNNELNKNSYSRAVGMLVTQNKTFTVYNAGNNLMMWAASAEMDSKFTYSEISRHNFNNNETIFSPGCAIIFADNYDCAYKNATSKAREMVGRGSKRYTTDSVTTTFECVHIIPLDQFGQLLLNLISTININDTVINYLGLKDCVLKYSFCRCQAKNEKAGEYYFIACDSNSNDIEVLSRYINDGDSTFKTVNGRIPVTVVCFNEQREFLESVFGNKVRYHQIDIQKFIRPRQSVQEKQILYLLREFGPLPEQILKLLTGKSENPKAYDLAMNNLKSNKMIYKSKDNYTRISPYDKINNKSLIALFVFHYLYRTLNNKHPQKDSVLGQIYYRDDNTLHRILVVSPGEEKQLTKFKTDNEDTIYEIVVTDSKQIDTVKSYLIGRNLYFAKMRINKGTGILEPVFYLPNM